MRTSLIFVAIALAAGAAAPPASAAIVTKDQVAATAGSAAGTAVAGPVGGAVGGLVGKVVGGMIGKDKPPEVAPTQAPPMPGGVQQIGPPKTLEVATVKTDAEATIPVERPPPEAQPAPAQAADNAETAAQPATATAAAGTLDDQLKALTAEPAP